jgi:2,3-bisphosphoglycerate-dependent phosphoglycerate mutase
MANLILLRHGESQWNLENRFTGWVDVDLTPKGEAEAKKAGWALKGMQIDYLFTSVLKRAMRTAEIALKESGHENIPTERSEKLNERHYGDLQGLNKDETRAKYGDEQVHIWRRSFDVPPPNGECLSMCQKRTMPYYREHIEPKLKAGKNVLIVAHGNSLRAILMEIEGLTKEQILEVNIPTGTPFMYKFDENLKVLEKVFLLPETAHK